MSYRTRYGRINVKLLVILILVTTALGVSLVAARQIRRSVLAKMALAAGETAFEKRDWPAAYKNLQEYLGRNPDNVEILKKYAQARMSIRPLERANIAGAISAYRRVLQLAPREDVAYEKLAVLYTRIGNWGELAYIARMRLGRDPNDPNGLQAHRWLADALVGLNKASEAQQDLEQFIRRLEPLSGKRVDCAKACVALSQVVLAGAATDAKAEVLNEALKQLDKAVAYDANSAEARAYRARFYRQTSNLPDVNVCVVLFRHHVIPLYTVISVPRLILARQDLESADKLGTNDPRVRYLLGSEWMAHSDLDRAAAELQAIDTLAPPVLEEAYFDIDDWKVLRFRLASQLAIRRQALADGAALADRTLAALKEERHRIQVLPAAIVFYVANGQASQARRCLEEYLKARHTQEAATQSREQLAYLQALVAKAEGNWYTVIDMLQPVVVGDTSHPEWRRLLADAFSRTNQSRRAVNVLTDYLRIRSGDLEMSVRLAQEYLRLRDWTSALEAARRAESLPAADYRVRLLRIEAGVYAAAAQQQEPAPALFSKLSEELTQLRADHPEDVDIRILQAIIADDLGQSDQVETELKLAIEQCKEPLKAEMQLAEYYRRGKRLDDAARVCRDACARHPGAAEPWLALATLHAAQKDYQAGRDCLTKGLDATTGKQERRLLSIELAKLELVEGDRTAGTRRLQALAEQDPHDVPARLLLLRARLGEMQRLLLAGARGTGDPAATEKRLTEERAAAEKLIAELKQPEGEGQSGLQWRLLEASLGLLDDNWRSRQREITSDLQYCVDADPAWSEPVLLLARTYEKLGDARRAEDIYRQALVRNPAAEDVADGLLTLLESQHRSAEAVKVLQQTRLNARFASAWQVRTALGTGDLSRAIDELKLRISSEGQDAITLIQLARLIYKQTKDPAQAFPYLKQAEAMAPDSLALIRTKAAILGADNQKAEARKVFDDYMERHKDFATYLARASYLAGEGELEQAEADYRKLTTFPQDSVAGYELLSSFYAGQKDLDKAVATLEEGLKANPGDSSLERRLMRLLLQQASEQGRERGIEILTSLEKRLPQDPELMWWRAMLLLEKPTAESIEKAKALLENVVKLEPTAVDAHRALIRLAMQASEYGTALDCAKRALGSNLNNPALLLARADAELALRNYATAGELAHQVLQADPNRAEAIEVLVETGQRSNNRKLLDEARTRIETAVRNAPTDERLLLSRARIVAALGQPQAAVPELEAYCQTPPGSRSIAALVALADLYRLAGDPDRSRQRIEQAQQLDSSDPAVVHARLLWLVSQNRLEELQGISTAYLAAKEPDSAVLVRAASILATLKPMELKREGLKLFERAVTLSPTSLDARLGLASVLYQTGDPNRAERVFREVLKQHPTSTRALNDLAWILQEHDQRHEEALELADKGLRIDPDDLNLLDTRGTILMNLPNRLGDAKNDFARLVNLVPEKTTQKAKALLRLGRICAQLGDAAQAKQHLQAALDIDSQIHVFTEAERSEIAKIIPPGGK